MAKEFPRSLRVAEQLRRELAQLLREAVHDPRIGLITLADVEVSRDLAHARVYYSMLEGRAASADTQLGLVRAAGFLRRELGQRLHIKTVPRLEFVYDDTQERGERLSALIAEARAEDRERLVGQDEAASLEESPREAWS